MEIWRRRVTETSNAAKALHERRRHADKNGLTRTIVALDHERTHGGELPRAITPRGFRVLEVVTLADLGRPWAVADSELEGRISVATKDEDGWFGWYGELPEGVRSVQVELYMEPL